ncbi:hypothetical protein DK842_01460 [Chromobacterium phragmitis]|nr:hypothetical protein DK842_01460 [Chromobacterium phragmitis]
MVAQMRKQDSTIGEYAEGIGPSWQSIAGRSGNSLSFWMGMAGGGAIGAGHAEILILESPP